MKSKTIVSVCRMGPGTFEAKFKPLSELDCIRKIIVVRKEKGPMIEKLEYVVLPKISSNPIVHVILSIIYATKQVKKNNADFILAYHYVPYFFIAYFVSSLSGKPYILGQTGSDVQKFVKKPVLGKFLLHIIHRAYSLNVPGNSTSNFWKKMGVDNVRILHSTIDTDYFTPSAAKKSCDFLFLGRLERYKGVNYIIQAFANLVKEYPHTRLSIVGSGPFEEEFKELANSLGLQDNIVFHGFQSDTYKYYANSKIFVMASETEGLPCALMEAMSVELLCVSSIVGNIADILKNEITGFVYEYGDFEKLEFYMKEALENYDNYIEIRQNARKMIVENHSYASVKQKWRDILG